MNPFQLLAVGQSLVKKGNQPSPYKMDEQNLLPKFATVGRPVSLAPAPKPVEVPKDLFRQARTAEAEPAGEAPAAAPEAPKPYRVLVAAARPPAPRPAALKAAPLKAVVPKPVAEAKPEPKKKGFFGFGTKTRGGERMVQAELSLDSVKVMRNDLNDSDLEIVSKPSPAPVPAPLAKVEAPVSPVAKVEMGLPTVSGWKRWVGRLMGAMKLSN